MYLAQHFLVRPLTVTPFFGMHSWFIDEQTTPSISFFEMAHGCNRWEMTSKNAEDSSLFNEAMVADSQLVMETISGRLAAKYFLV